MCSRMTPAVGLEEGQPVERLEAERRLGVRELPDQAAVEDPAEPTPALTEDPIRERRDGEEIAREGGTSIRYGLVSSPALRWMTVSTPRASAMWTRRSIMVVLPRIMTERRSRDGVIMAISRPR